MRLRFEGGWTTATGSVLTGLGRAGQARLLSPSERIRGEPTGIGGGSAVSPCPGASTGRSAGARDIVFRIGIERQEFLEHGGRFEAD